MSNLGNKEVMAKNIQYYMDRQGIDRRKLSADLSISYTTLTDWLKAKTYPRIDKIEMLSNYFSISKADLVEERHPATTITQISDTTAKLEEPRQKNVLSYAERQLEEQLHEQEKEGSKIVSLNEKRQENSAHSSYRTAECRGALGAGLGISNFYEDITDEETYEWPRIPIPDDAPYNFDWVYTASGDSMEPLFQDGDIVYVKELEYHERSNLDTDTIYAVRVDGVSYLKRIRITEQGMYLVSLNKKYNDILVSEESNIKVVGKVVV
ncbi:S24 family peptidase [Enterococcus faecalis]|uniref:S24 family peptidase n=1 Tax=Enterococcus faecalis TaxID=1351 RepID=UPI003D12E361